VIDTLYSLRQVYNLSYLENHIRSVWRPTNQIDFNGSYHNDWPYRRQPRKNISRPQVGKFIHLNLQGVSQRQHHSPGLLFTLNQKKPWIKQTNGLKIARPYHCPMVLFSVRSTTEMTRTFWLLTASQLRFFLANTLKRNTWRFFETRSSRKLKCVKKNAGSNQPAVAKEW